MQAPDPAYDNDPNITVQPEIFIGDFVSFEKASSDYLIDDEVRTVIITLFNWIYSLPGKQASTSEAYEHLCNQNADYKKILKSIVGICKLLSVEFVIKQATAGNNFLRIVGNGNAPLFNLAHLGGKYTIGQKILLYSCKSTMKVLQPCLDNLQLLLVYFYIKI